MSRDPGRVRTLIDNPHVGAPPCHADVTPPAAELLKDRIGRYSSIVASWCDSTMPCAAHGAGI
jgi:hypothetical protein